MEREKNTDWTRTSATPPHDYSTRPCSQNVVRHRLSKGWPSLSFIFRLRNEQCPLECPVRHCTFNMSKSELTRSLTPDRGCQPAGHTCVIPSAKDAFPCAWGVITWATSRVKPWPLLILLPWVTRVPALPCPGEKAHGNSTFSMFHQRRKRSPPVQPARWPSKGAPPRRPPPSSYHYPGLPAYSL